MRYKSMHIGTTYYSLGKDILNTGEVIEFGCYTNSDYSAKIWKIEADSLERIQNKNNLKQSSNFSIIRNVNSFGCRVCW